MHGQPFSRFGDRPRTSAAWWSMGLGLGAVLILVASMVLPDADVSVGQLNIVPALVLVLGIGALASGIAAYRRGDHSFVVWIGLVIGMLFALLLIAELAFLE
jgi:ABC-type multidrug transport system permease subunit